MNQMGTGGRRSEDRRKLMNKCELAKLVVEAAGWGPVLVLAIFTLRLRFTVFLTLQVALWPLDAVRFEIGGKLSWKLELNAVHAKTLCGFDIGRDVINVKGFVGANFEGAQGFLVYEGIGFAGPDSARINANGEEIEKAVVAFHVTDVDGVGIGKEGKTVAFGKALDKRILLDGDWVEGAIPDFAELLKGKPCPKTLIQVEIPVAWRDATFLPVGPARILLDGRPKLRGGQRGARGQSLHGAGDVNADEDAADVEDNGAELLRRHGLI